MNTSNIDARSSRSQTPRASDSRGRSTSRPRPTRRDSSPMTKIVTYGLMASTAALAAALPHSGMQQPMGGRPGIGRRPSRFEEDMQEAGLRRRDNGVNWQQATGNVDWDTALQGVDWSKVDYSGTDNNAAQIASSVVTNADVQASTQKPSSQPTQSATAITSAAATQVALAPTSTTSAAVASTAAPSGSVSALQTGGASAYFDGIGDTDNAIAIVWRGSTQMTFNFYSDVAAFQPQFGDAYQQVVLEPNSFKTVTLPQGFSGRVQKMTGRVDEPATWAELTFDGWKGLTFFDVSYIRGYDGPCVMKAVDNSAISGTDENFLNEAPADDQSTTSLGHPYLKATEGFDGSVTSDLVDFYRSKVPTNTGYVRNFDDGSSKATANKHLVISYS